MGTELLWIIPLAWIAIIAAGVAGIKLLARRVPIDRLVGCFTGMIAALISIAAMVTGVQDRVSFKDFLQHSVATTGRITSFDGGVAYYTYSVVVERGGQGPLTQTTCCLAGRVGRAFLPDHIDNGDRIRVLYDGRRPSHSEAGDLYAMHRETAIERFGFLGLALPLALVGIGVWMSLRNMRVESA